MRPTFLYLLLGTVLWSWHALEVRHEWHVAEMRSQSEARRALLARSLFALGEIDSETGKPRVVGLIQLAFAIEGVDWDESEVEAMARICWRESRYDPTQSNPRSTAYGLYQFLDSTWQHHGIEKTSDPLLQTVAAVRYIKGRYGRPTDALAFHLEAHAVGGKTVHYY